MPHAPDVVVDVAIFGGGIAGLWTLDRLVAAGLSAVLFETSRLGEGQSVASQGIIHGGAKYTLVPGSENAVPDLEDMPARWRASLAGRDGPDLSKARTLSEQTLVWIPEQIGGDVTGAPSGRLPRSRVRALARADWPGALSRCGSTDAVYTLEEIVVDVPSVLAALQDAHRDRIRRVPPGASPTFAEVGPYATLGGLTIAAQRFLFAAGAGNEDLLARAGLRDVPHQRRPLRQILIGGMTEPLYAHCVGGGDRPLATVTAHPVTPGEYVWCVGGEIAEAAVGDSETQAIVRARHTLPGLLPAADFSAARWATLRVDRAEAAASRGRMPSGPTLASRSHYLAAWPTKLALAPALATRVLDLLASQGIRPGASDIATLADWDQPEVAPAAWEEIASWS